MNTPFEKLDWDTRRMWRDDPTTQAFLDTVMQQEADITTGALAAMRGGGLTERQSCVVGGELRALEFVRALANKVPRRG